MPDYRFRSVDTHENILEEVSRAAVDAGVGLVSFTADGQFVRVHVREVSELFVARLQELAIGGEVVEASERNTSWADPSSPW
jgi:hypothetical protein